MTHIAQPKTAEERVDGLEKQAADQKMRIADLADEIADLEERVDELRREADERRRVDASASAILADIRAAWLRYKSTGERFDADDIDRCFERAGLGAGAC